MINVLIVDQSFMGDVLMSSPAYRAVRAHFGRVEILTLPESAEVVGHSHCADKIHSSWKTVKDVDIAIHLHTSFKTNVIMWLKRIPVRIGYSYKWCGWPLTVKIPIEQRTIRKGYRVDEVCNLLEEAFGWEVKDRGMIFE